MTFKIQKTPPKWINSTVLTGGIILFSGIFLVGLTSVSIWTVFCVSLPVIFVPLLFVKSDKGTMRIKDGKLVIDFKNEDKHTLDLNLVRWKKIRISNYEGKVTLPDLFSSLWPYKSGFENPFQFIYKGRVYKYQLYISSIDNLKTTKNYLEKIKTTYSND